MNLSAYWKPSFLLLAFAAAASSTAPASVDTAAIAETIKADVAQLVAGLNAHDAVKTTAYDTPNIISMECGSPSTVGVEADREGFKMGFTRDLLMESQSHRRDGGCCEQRRLGSLPAAPITRITVVQAC